MKPIKYKKPEIRKYSIAPYNFISFPKRAIIKYAHPKELPPHNNFKNRDGKELLSGTIDYTIEAKTPIMVSNGIDNKNAYFFKNTDGQYAIPANTIRGLLRTNCQILSFSNVVKADDSGYGKSEIQDSRFLFRDVAGGNALSKLYGNILNIDRNKRVSRNLRAGYMYCENKNYYIEESEKLIDLRNYFRIDEFWLRKDNVDNDIKNSISYMYDNRLLDIEERIKELNKTMAPNNGSTSPSEKNKAKWERLRLLEGHEANYKQYSMEISFTYDKEKGNLTRIGNRTRHENKGYLLSGGFIGGKMSHYVVPAPSNSANRVNVSESDIIQYKDDLMFTKKMNKKEGIIERGWEFFDLPKPGEKKPVFFIKTDRLHFGFTPYLRMFYSKSVLDGLGSEYKNVKGISYTDSIFGFSDMKYGKNTYSYKSRVSFKDAIAENGELDKDSSITMLLAEPKATSYNLYLKQGLNKNKKELSVYDGEFYLRGIKQYWLKSYVEEPVTAKNDKMTFKIHPLKEGTIFKGKIYFKNLEEDELGLILWSLRLNENCFQSIGLAKPYGFGRAKVTSINLKLEDLKKKYGEFSFDFMNEADVDGYIGKYKHRFSTEYLNTSVDESQSVKELMYIKSRVVEEKDSNWYRYMLLKYDNKNLKEFNEKRVLPTILEYDSVIRSAQNYGHGGEGRQRREGPKSRTRGHKDNREFGSSMDALANWGKNKKKK